MRWQWVPYNSLQPHELYAIMKLRQEVFIVEQNCPYLDADGYDSQCWHLLGWGKGEQADGSPEVLHVYLRVVLAGVKYPEFSIGRVVSAQSVRRTGAGKQLVSEALMRIRDQFGDVALRISAQQYLERFYTGFGFKTVSEPYMEDNIPHIQMFRAALS